MVIAMAKKASMKNQQKNKAPRTVDEMREMNAEATKEIGKALRRMEKIEL